MRLESFSKASIGGASSLYNNSASVRRGYGTGTFVTRLTILLHLHQNTGGAVGLFDSEITITGGSSLHHNIAAVSEAFAALPGAHLCSP